MGCLRFIRSKVKSVVFYLLCTVLFILVLSFFRFSVVDGNSMLDTLKDGDLLLIFQTTDVKYKDVVAIESTELDKFLCKRVIGVAGDTVKIKDGVLTINGEEIHEAYIKDQNWGSSTDIEVKVPENKVFVMGDNRNDSLDSRDLGVLNIDDIVGTLVMDITKYTGLSFIALRSLIIVCWVILFIGLLTNKKADKA